MSTAALPVENRRGLLDRVLGLFTEVRGGEGLTALLLALNVYLLLTTYYIIKPVREALILAGGGAEVKSYAAAGQALLLLGAVPAYAALASHFSRMRLINTVTIFFALCLVGFWIWGTNPTFRVPLGAFDLTVGIAFYLWVGIFNMMVVAQFWAFANDLYTPEEGKRLFALVAFGASAGAVSGSVIAGILIEPIGVEMMLLVAAALLVATLVITNGVDGRERRRAHARAEAAARSRLAPSVTPAEAPIGKGGAFGLVWSNRYLLLIAFLMLILNWVNTTGEYILGRVVSADAAARVASGAAGTLGAKELIGKFYADYFSVVNVVGLLIQLFLVSRILKWFGVRVAILILPIIALGGYALLVFVPVLSYVRWVKTAENAADYSIQNTVRQTLFLPTTREQKYKAKQAIDTFFVRCGDLLSAGIVFLGTSVLAFETQQFALVNSALVLVWILIALAIGRENAKLTGEA